MAETTVCITGGERGLGLALARRWLGLGCRVFCGLYQTDHPEFDESEAGAAGQLQGHVLDVTEDDSVSRFKQWYLSRTDRMDILVNNAGIAPGRDKKLSIGDELSFDLLTTIHSVNALGPLRMTSQFIDLLLQSEAPKLVNVSSIAASLKLLERSNQLGYVMSKTALNAQSKLIFNRLKERGLSVYLVHPGWMPTLLHDDDWSREHAQVQPDDAARDIIHQISTRTCGDEPLFLDAQGNILPW
jgi:NAD(P)-dependent dehydrogenase (short-subunit alcohol dehydrogenase family)